MPNGCWQANGSHVGFEGLDGAKVYRGTAKGFLEDVTDDELQGWLVGWLVFLLIVPC